VEPAENGAAMKWWIWVCPACIEGRLHVAGYSRDRHGLYTVCDRCGSTFAR
jgi:transposase-like protein